MPWWIATVGAFVVAIAAAAWWWVPKWQVNRLRLKIRDPKARADVEDNFRKTIGQLLGGAAVLIGASLAYYGTQRTLQASDEQSRQSVQASRDLLISQQASKGFEDLSSGNLMTRLGGIYALEGVMNASEQYHQPALEALCAFVRDGTKTYTGGGPPATDIEAALTVIGRRAPGSGFVDLADARIPKAMLRGADLRLAHLNGTELTNANLTRVHLKGAQLPDAKLTHAYLIFADLIDANLTGAKMQGAMLDEADLTDANLAGADLHDADLKNANLSGADLQANLTDADLRGANLHGAILTGSAAVVPAFNRPKDFIPTWSALIPLPGKSGLIDMIEVRDADLTNTDMTETNVLQSQLDHACGTGTKLPPGLTLKPCLPAQHPWGAASH